MNTQRRPNICVLVDHVGGQAELARKLGTSYQNVQSWVYRGWVAPAHIAKLEPLMPPGMTMRDLFEDKEFAMQAARNEPQEARDAA